MITVYSKVTQLFSESVIEIKNKFETKWKQLFNIAMNYISNI